MSKFFFFVPIFCERLGGTAAGRRLARRSPLAASLGLAARGEGLQPRGRKGKAPAATNALPPASPPLQSCKQTNRQTDKQTTARWPQCPARPRSARKALASDPRSFPARAPSGVFYAALDRRYNGDTRFQAPSAGRGARGACRLPGPIKSCSLALVLNTVNPVYSANTSKSNLEKKKKKGKAGNCLFVFAVVRNAALFLCFYLWSVTTKCTSNNNRGF